VVAGTVADEDEDCGVCMLAVPVEDLPVMSVMVVFLSAGGSGRGDFVEVESCKALIREAGETGAEAVVVVATAASRPSGEVSPRIMISSSAR
jgi:hypothetical protein